MAIDPVNYPGDRRVNASRPKRSTPRLESQPSIEFETRDGVLFFRCLIFDNTRTHKDRCGSIVDSARILGWSEWSLVPEGGGR